MTTSHRRGYLRGFVQPGRLNTPKPLWVFSIERQEWSERSPKGFGGRQGLRGCSAPLGVSASRTSPDPASAISIVHALDRRGNGRLHPRL